LEAHTNAIAALLTSQLVVIHATQVAPVVTQLRRLMDAILQGVARSAILLVGVAMEIKLMIARLVKAECI